MRSFLLILSIISLSQFSHAAGDTTWLNSHWRLCKDDTATYYTLAVKQSGEWKQNMYYAKTNHIFMTGTFKDNACTIKTGSFTWYDQTGQLTDSIVYKDGNPVYLNHFHDNGKVKTLLIYENNRATYVNSWDRSGAVSYCDTFYHDRLHNECHRDTAWIKGIIKKEDSIWHLRFYYMDDGSLYINSYYKERLCRTRTGIFTKYVNRKIIDSILYDDNGKKKALWQFRNDCSLSAYRTFDSAGKVTGGKNWTENGNEIIINPVIKFPVAPGGFKRWKKGIIAQLNKDKTIDPALRSGYYGNISARMIIDKHGKMLAAYIDAPSPFADMDSLIIKTILQSSQWKPGTVYGEPADFTMYCNLFFVKGVVSGKQEVY